MEMFDAVSNPVFFNSSTILRVILSYLQKVIKLIAFHLVDVVTTLPLILYSMHWS